MGSKTGIIDNAAKRREYHEELGKFVNAFAKAEAFTHISFHAFAKLDPTLAMALKGGMRLGDLMPAIRRIMKINGFSEQDRAEVDALFVQLNEISIFRDRILHRGADLTEDGTFESNNLATMKALENLEVVRFKLTDIRSATVDLRRITMRLARFIAPDPEEDADTQLQEYLRAPWLYIPVKLETPNRRRPAAPPSQQRRRRSSQESE